MAKKKLIDADPREEALQAVRTIAEVSNMTVDERREALEQVIAEAQDLVDGLEEQDEPEADGEESDAEEY